MRTIGRITNTHVPWIEYNGSQNDATWIQMKNALDLFKMAQLTKWARRLDIYHSQDFTAHRQLF